MRKWWNRYRVVVYLSTTEEIILNELCRGTPKSSFIRYLINEEYKRRIDAKK